MGNDDAAARKIVDCANKVLGTSLSLAPGGDIPLKAFDFDSLSLFAFLLEINAAFGIDFDDLLAHEEQMVSVRSVAALIESSH
jgi:acyl carrier protein